MADPLDNVNEVLESLEKEALHTTQGSYVRIEHVRRLLEGRKEEQTKEKEKRLEQRPPRNFAEARRQIKNDPEIMAGFERKGLPELGKAVPSTEPQPPSRA